MAMRLQLIYVRLHCSYQKPKVVSTEEAQSERAEWRELAQFRVTHSLDSDISLLRRAY